MPVELTRTPAVPFLQILTSRSSALDPRSRRLDRACRSARTRPAVHPGARPPRGGPISGLSTASVMSGIQPQASTASHSETRGTDRATSTRPALQRGHHDQPRGRSTPDPSPPRTRCCRQGQPTRSATDPLEHDARATPTTTRRDGRSNARSARPPPAGARTGRPTRVRVPRPCLQPRSVPPGAMRVNGRSWRAGTPAPGTSIRLLHSRVDRAAVVERVNFLPCPRVFSRPRPTDRAPAARAPAGRRRP